MGQSLLDAAKNHIGSRHSSLGIAAIDHLQAILFGCGLEVYSAHRLLQRERSLVNILTAIQVAAIVTLTLLGQLAPYASDLTVYLIYTYLLLGLSIAGFAVLLVSTVQVAHNINHSHSSINT